MSSTTLRGQVGSTLAATTASLRQVTQLTCLFLLIHLLNLQKGIEPDWADFQNKYGGRWVIEWKDQDLRFKDDIDSYWMEILFILIGEHGHPYNAIVNGAVINVRKNKFRIGVWLKVGRFFSFLVAC